MSICIRAGADRPSNTSRRVFGRYYSRYRLIKTIPGGPRFCLIGVDVCRSRGAGGKRIDHQRVSRESNPLKLGGSCIVASELEYVLNGGQGDKASDNAGHHRSRQRATYHNEIRSVCASLPECGSTRKCHCVGACTHQIRRTLRSPLRADSEFGQETLKS
jgi:hypothetical protein